MLSLKLHCDLWCAGNFNARCSAQADIQSKTHVMELRYDLRLRLTLSLNFIRAYEIFHFRLKIEANVKSKNPLGPMVHG